MPIYQMNMNQIPNVSYMGKVNYVDPWIHFKRTIDEYSLYIVKSGVLYIQEGNEKYEITQGKYIVLEANVEHVGYKEASCNYYFIHFKTNEMKRITEEHKKILPKELMVNRTNSLNSDLFHCATTIYPIYFPKIALIENHFEIFRLLDLSIIQFYKKQENFKYFASLELNQILITLSQSYHNHVLQEQENTYFIKLRKLVFYLENNYMHKIHSKDIEDYLDTNYDYINRLFKKYFNVTIVTYLNNMRIEAAKELMILTNSTFDEIAEQVGLNDQYYFSKLFKKITGVTPNHYRQNMASEIRYKQHRIT